MAALLYRVYFQFYLHFADLNVVANLDNVAFTVCRDSRIFISWENDVHSTTYSQVGYFKPVWSAGIKSINI